MGKWIGRIWNAVANAFLVRDIIVFLSLKEWITVALAFASGLVVEAITDHWEFLVYGVWCAGLIVFTAKWDAIVAWYRGRPLRRDLKIAEQEFIQSRDEMKLDQLRLGTKMNKLRTPSKWGSNQESKAKERE